jgi:hypothetical protein
MPHAHRSRITAQALAAVIALVPAGMTWSEPLPDGGVTAPEVAKVLQDKGYVAKIGVDKGGDPEIHSSAEGSGFDIFFYGCKKGPRCSSLQFSSAYHVDGGMKLEQINKWARKTRFGRAYLDDVNDPFIEMDLDVEHGFSTEALANNLDTWVAVRADFLTMMHCASKPASDPCNSAGG